MENVINNDHHFDFNSQMQFGKIGEDLIIQIYKDKKNCVLVDVRNDKEYQDKDIDFIVQKFNAEGKLVSKCPIEVKCDMTNTGNIFAETYVSTDKIVNGETQNVGAKFGWIYLSKAEYVFYFYPATGQLFIINRAKFASWIDERHIWPIEKHEKDEQGREILNTEDYDYLATSSKANFGGKDGKNENIHYYGIGVLVPINHLETLAQTEKGKSRPIVTVVNIKEKYGIDIAAFLRQYDFLKPFAYSTINRNYCWLHDIYSA